MTAYETAMFVLGILGLLVSFAGFVIAFIAFLDKRNKRKNNPPCLLHRVGIAQD